MNQRMLCDQALPFCCEFADELLSGLRARVRGIRESEDLLLRDLRDAEQRYLESADRIFGWRGSGAKFITSAVGVGSLRPGFSETINAINTVAGVAQEPLSATEWGDVLVEIFTSGTFLSLQDKARLIELTEHTNRVVELTGDRQLAAREYWKRAQSIDTRNAATQTALKGAGALLALYDYIDSTLELFDDIDDWYQARVDSLATADALDQADQRREALQQQIDALLTRCSEEGESGSGSYSEDILGTAAAQSSFCETPPSLTNPALVFTGGGPVDPSIHSGFYAVEGRARSETVANDSNYAQDAAALLAGQRLLEQLRNELDETIEHFYSDVLPPLYPLLSDTWRELESGVLHELMKMALPELRAMEGKLSALTRLGSDVMTAIGGTADPAGQADNPLAYGTGLRIVGVSGHLTPESWLVSHHGAGSGAVITAPASRDSSSIWLSPGTYDVYISALVGRSSTPLLFAEGVRIPEDGFASLMLSGISLTVSDWVPERDQTHGWWGVVRATESVDNRIQWTNLPDPLLLPPGAYDIYWRHDFEDGPMLLAQNVHVDPGALTTVPANSGIHLAVAPWVPEPQASHGWWGAVRSGDPPDELVQRTRLADAILLPPGLYDVYWKQDFGNKPMLIKARVRIGSGELVEMSATSGVRLQNPADLPELQPSHGWWGAVPTGGEPGDRIQWSGDKSAPILVPPGTYDIYWKQNFEERPRLIKQGLVVRPAELVVVRASP
jgi:hypothetical protein